eukprot:3939705-Pleurochrysis_carterae.AAC.1
MDKRATPWSVKSSAASTVSDAFTLLAFTRRCPSQIPAVHSIRQALQPCPRCKYVKTCELILNPGLSPCNPRRQVTKIVHSDSASDKFYIV